MLRTRIKKQKFLSYEKNIPETALLIVALWQKQVIQTDCSAVLGSGGSLFLNPAKLPDWLQYVSELLQLGTLAKKNSQLHCIVKSIFLLKDKWITVRQS